MFQEVAIEGDYQLGIQIIHALWRQLTPEARAVSKAIGLTLGSSTISYEIALRVPGKRLNLTGQVLYDQDRADTTAIAATLVDDVRTQLMNPSVPVS
jgi:hypothetical protein